MNFHVKYYFHFFLFFLLFVDFYHMQLFHRIIIHESTDHLSTFCGSNVDKWSYFVVFLSHFPLFYNIFPNVEICIILNVEKLKCRKLGFSTFLSTFPHFWSNFLYILILFLFFLSSTFYTLLSPPIIFPHFFIDF